jgi:hypothetical protein
MQAAQCQLVVDDVGENTSTYELLPRDHAVLTLCQRHDYAIDPPKLELTRNIRVNSKFDGHGAMLAAQSARMVREALRVSL